MQKSTHGSRLGATARRHCALPILQCLIMVVAVWMSLAMPVRCSAQTLNLAPDSTAGIFENGGNLSVSNSSVINGNVETANNSPQVFVNAYSTINGNVEIGDNVVGSTNTPGPAPGIDPTSTVNGLVYTSVIPVQATVSTVGTVPDSGEIDLENTSMKFNGTSAVNVFNINGVFNAINSSINLFEAAANETFVFNVSGSIGGDGLVFQGVTINLNGVLPSNVIFNVENGNADIGAYINNKTSTTTTSTVYGTFYTNSNDITNSGDINVSGSSVVTGALVAGGGGDINILNSTVTAEPFVANAPIVAAPEMPTIMTAGLAAVSLVAGSYFSRLRRKHWSSGRLRAV